VKNLQYAIFFCFDYLKKSLIKMFASVECVKLQDQLCCFCCIVVNLVTFIVKSF